MKILLATLLVFSFLNASTPKANLVAVYTHVKNDGYKFGVTLRSEETGCNQYADWWEILNEKGELIYRRILVHSHPGEQPFTRWGSFVKVDKKDLLYIRAHMNIFGYSGNVFSGTVATGFREIKEFPDFNNSIEKQAPLPKGCLY
jgi:hypothetical protein